MSKYVKCERREKQPAADSEYEAEGLECFTNSLSIRVEYYRSFEYSLKWKTPMSPRRSSRLSEVAKRSPSSDEEVIQRRLKGKRRRTGLKKTKGGNSVVTDEGRDIIDIINSTDGTKHVADEDEGKFVSVTDEGLDESDEDRHSVTSSIASGPSLLRNASPKKPRPSQGLCSACRTLQQRAKKMKAPIKSKLLDTDPKSLTCDQWVLIKTWKPRRLPNGRGKLLIHVQLLKKRLRVKNGTNRPAPCVDEGESSACSRPHPFLQRNLKRVRVPVKRTKKSSRRKRTRTGSQSPRAAKQQRLHGNSHISVSSADMSGPHSTSGHSSPGRGADEGDEADTNQSGELTPSSVSLETSKTREAPPERKAPKKRGGFRDLLVQLRGNSTIVRETR